MNKEQKQILENVNKRLAENKTDVSQSEDRSIMDDVRGGIGKIASGATFGYIDEMRALVRTELDDALMGMGLKPLYGNKSYEQNLAEGRKMLDDFGEANPKTALGLELGGGALTGGASAAKVLGTKLIQNAPKLAQYLASGGVGAGQGFVAGSGYAKEGERLKRGGIGAAISGPLGVAIPAAIGGVQRMIAPKSNVSNAANMLIKEGVSLTPGQRLGGTVQMIEDAATSFLPPIRGAQARGIEDFNRVVINKALAPIGEKLSDKVPVGREAVAEMLEKASNAYKKLLPNLRFNMDTQFRSQLNEVIDNAQFLSDATLKKFNKVVEKNLASKLDNKMGMSGESFKTAESTLGKLATTLSKSTDEDAVQLTGAVKQLQTLMRESLERTNPSQAAQLKNANKTYRMISIVEDASAKAPGKFNGVFNPSQFDRAVKGAKTMGKPKRQYVKGQATMQELSDPAVQRLSPTIPESGTAPRFLTALLAGGGAGAIDPTAGAITGLVAGAYTRPGQQILNALVNRPLSAPRYGKSIDILKAPGIGAGATYGGRN